MKPWSRHNTLYHSSRFGWLLHNALSGTMLELDDHHGKIAGSIRDGASIHMADGGAFISVLEEQGFLLAPEEEDETFMEIRYRRNMTCFSTGYIAYPSALRLHATLPAHTVSKAARRMAP